MRILTSIKPLCFLLVSCTIALMATGCHDYMVKSPSEFGESAYIALKNNDQAGFRSLLVEAGDMDVVFEIQSQHSSKKRSREEFDAEMKAFLNDMDAEAPEKFSQMREEGIVMGINWEQIEFKGVDVSPERLEDGFRIVDIKAFFTSNNEDFTLSFDNIANLGGNYTADRFPSLEPYNP